MGSTQVIYDIFKNIKQTQRHDGEYGLELETETLVPYDIPAMKYWQTHPDGSLRDFGIEYILRSPLKYEEQIPAALEEFKKVKESILKNQRVEFKNDPVSASCHVHINMLNDTFKTMGNFLALYVLFENILVRYSGPNRLSNLFCLPIVDAEETAKNIKSLLNYVDTKSYRNIWNFNENSCKYASLNISSLPRRGSLEVRSFRGSTDIKEIHDWVSVLHSMMTFARQDITPITILEEYRNKGSAFGNDVFGKYFPALKHPDIDKLLEKNLWYLQDSVVYAVSDWNTVDKQLEKKKVNNKTLDALALKMFKVPFSDLTPSRQEYVVIMANNQQLSEMLHSYERRTVDWVAEVGPTREPITINTTQLNVAPTTATNNAAMRNTPTRDLPNMNDVVQIYRRTTDEVLEMEYGNTRFDDEVLDIVRRAA